MFSIPAKLLLPLVALSVFFFSCSREREAPPWEPQSHLSGKVYNGGLFPVWIELKEPVKDANIISWKTGSSRIAYRTQAVDTVAKLIKADTAFLYWETPPPPFVKIDSLGPDSVITTYYYRDTIFAIVDGQESLPIVIEVKNILPRIESISINGLKQPGDSLLTIAAHPGDKMTISINLEKPFNDAFYPIVTMPTEMGNLKVVSESKVLFVYEWTVPNEIITDSTYLKIKDSGGHGERFYKVHLIVYTESGSTWVASEKEIVKYSPTGVEVARISENFGLISALAVNSNNGRLFVTDQSKNIFAIYDTYGKRLYSDSLFKMPTGVAVNVEGNYVWVADEAKLRRFALAGDSIRAGAAASYSNMSGPVKGLAVDQFRKDFVWFAIPQNDTVGYVENDSLKYLPNIWNRPSMVSLDPINGMAWVADSSRIMAIDTTGKILANIKGFGFVSSISASGGSVWALDIFKGKVYRFKGPFRGSMQDTSLTVLNGMDVNYGFISPVSVSAFAADGGAWVVDKEAGQAIRLDSLGNIMASGTGLKLPNLNVTLQKVE